MGNTNFQQVDSNTIIYNGDTYTAISSDDIRDCETRPCPFFDQQEICTSLACAAPSRKDNRDIIWELQDKKEEGKIDYLDFKVFLDRYLDQKKPETLKELADVHETVTEIVTDIFQDYSDEHLEGQSL